MLQVEVKVKLSVEAFVFNFLLLDQTVKMLFLTEQTVFDWAEMVHSIWSDDLMEKFF